MAPRNKENSGRASKRKSRDGGGDQADSGAEDDYRKRRDRNNAAVKRSRVKSRLRTQETLDRVHKLKTENDQLEEKIKLLSKELGFLKDLFLAHAGSAHGITLEDVDLEALLNDSSTTSLINIDKPPPTSASAVDTKPNLLDL
ncbi:inverted repeat binding protein 18 kDa isoform X2 [Lycorma delicatula]